jgi:hypothetical protein
MIGIRIRVLQFNGDDAGAQERPAIGFNTRGGGCPSDGALVLLRMSRFLDYSKNQKDHNLFP